MPVTTVWFIDTSVLTEILQVPGKSQQAEVIATTYEERRQRGDRFVIPLTTLIETGNHIAQCSGDRRAAAQRFIRAVEASKSNTPPWIIRDVAWDGPTLHALLRGDSTGSDLLELLSSGRMGAGDVALLVERDAFRASMAFHDVRIWSLEQELSSFERM